MYAWSSLNKAETVSAATWSQAALFQSIHGSLLYLNSTLGTERRPLDAYNQNTTAE